MWCPTRKKKRKENGIGTQIKITIYTEISILTALKMIGEGCEDLPKPVQKFNVEEKTLVMLYHINSYKLNSWLFRSNHFLSLMLFL